MNFSNYVTTDVLNNTFVRIALTIALTIILQYIVRLVVERLVRRLVWPYRYENKTDERKREDTIISIFRTATSAILWIVAVITILSLLGVNFQALLTTAGVFTVVIGFGAQQAIRDILAGIFILTENQYRVGDVVSLKGGATGDGASGVVEEFSLRITKLRDLDGTLNIIRNGEAAVILNRTFKQSAVVVDFYVAIDSDMAKVQQVVNDVGLELYKDEEWHKKVVRQIAFLRVDAIEAPGIKVRALGRVQPACQWEVAGEYRRRMISAFKKAKVDLVV